MSPAGLGRPVQIAYVVPDVVEHASRWAEQFGAGPFFVRRHIPLASVTYRGAPATFDHTSAYGQWGDVMLELVQDHGPGPNVVTERFAPGDGGLHHLAFFVDDVDDSLRALAAAGAPTAMEATTSSGLRFAFADTTQALGHHIELYPRTDHLAAFYEQVAEASRGWDGSEPIRML